MENSQPNSKVQVGWWCQNPGLEEKGQFRSEMYHEWILRKGIHHNPEPCRPVFYEVTATI